MSLRSRYDKLEPRERKLLSGLGLVLVAFLFILLPVSLYQALSTSRQKNVELRDLIESIEDARGQIAERKAKHDAMLSRYAKPAPPLAGFIEEAARANDLAVPESQDKPEVPHGKRYTERITSVKMHRIGMRNLSKMLEKIEQSGFPVAITRLNIKPRTGEPDSYEVELAISAYDRKSDAVAAPAAPAPEEGDDQMEEPL